MVRVELKGERKKMTFGVVEEPKQMPSVPLDPKSFRQTGTVKSLARDAKRTGRAPGKRISKAGNIYYEYRKNRSDIPGKRI